MAAKRENYGRHVVARAMTTTWSSPLGTAAKIVMTLPGTPRATNHLNSKGHWARRKQADEWKTTVRNLVRSSGVKPPGPMDFFNIVVWRLAPVLMDYDGLVASLKPIIDGLTESGVIANDNYSRTGPWRVYQYKTKSEHARIVIELLQHNSSMVELGEDPDLPKCSRCKERK